MLQTLEIFFFQKIESLTSQLSYALSSAKNIKN